MLLPGQSDGPGSRPLLLRSPLRFTARAAGIPRQVGAGARRWMRPRMATNSFLDGHLGKPEDHVAGVLDDPIADLHQSLPERRQRPVTDARRRKRKTEWGNECRAQGQRRLKSQDRPCPEEPRSPQAHATSLRLSIFASSSSIPSPGLEGSGRNPPSGTRGSLNKHCRRTALVNRYS